MPVILPPGRARLCHEPSADRVNAVRENDRDGPGVFCSAFSGRALGDDASALGPTSSTASAASPWRRSARAFLDRHVAAFDPPVLLFLKAPRKAWHCDIVGDRVQDTTRRIRSAGCARGAIGHPATAPPSSVMNSRRRIIRSPRRQQQAGSARARQTKRLCGVEIDHQFEFCRLNGGHIGRLLAF